MKALQVKRSVGRLGLARVASALAPAAAVRVGPLDFTEVDDPELPGPGLPARCTRAWPGICGSDLSMIEGHASTYFDDWVSFPFVPGHEVVGHLDDGTRVVLEPVLGHEARGFAPPFEGAAPGDGDDYAHLADGTPRARHPDRLLLLDRRRLGAVVLGPRHASSTRSATTSPTSGPCSSSRSPAASTPP